MSRPEAPLVRVEQVSKRYCRSLRRSLWYGLCDIGRELRGAPSAPPQLRTDEFLALRDVSVEVRRGETLGLVGPNGAGKTTLLKLVNGLVKPDAGRVSLTGRVSALIALGAGFSPVLTGRENVYVGGAVLGMTRHELDERMDEIIDFAEIGAFIDAPVQSYSSGMKVRLGFAIAATLSPDVLLLDEVLAVGDAAFRNKCYNRIGELSRSAAIIFVTHHMDQVAHICDRVLLLDRGEPVFLGEAAEGARRYEEMMTEAGRPAGAFRELQPPVTHAELELDRTAGRFGDQIKLSARLVVADAGLPAAYLRVCFYNQRNEMVAEWDGRRHAAVAELQPGENRLDVELGPLHLKNGRYDLGIQLHDHRQPLVMPLWSFKEHHVLIRDGQTGFAPYQLP